MVSDVLLLGKFCMFSVSIVQSFSFSDTLFHFSLFYFCGFAWIQHALFKIAVCPKWM